MEEETITSPVGAYIALLHQAAPGSIGDQMHFSVLEENQAQGTYTLRCETMPWMCNAYGTLHGGMCAAILDQAMGFVAKARLGDAGVAPTIQMQVNYHRPLLPGEDVLVRIRVLSETKSLISMFSEASLASRPERVCISATASSFLKREPKKN